MRKRYRLSALVTIPCYTVVEAESGDEALNIGECRELGRLRHRPFTDSEDETWHFEGDGMSFDLEVDDVVVPEID